MDNKEQLEEEKRCIMCGEEDFLTDENICQGCNQKLQDLDDREGWIKDKRKANLEEYEERIKFLEGLTK